MNLSVEPTKSSLEDFKRIDKIYYEKFGRVKRREEDPWSPKKEETMREKKEAAKKIINEQLKITGALAIKRNIFLCRIARNLQ